jgi:hypothetical protein
MKIMQENIFDRTEAKQRVLIYYPIVHTLEELGQLKEVVSQVTITQSGQKALERKSAAITRMWENIEKSIHDMSLPYETLRLYQDSLATCGKEKEIVRDLADQGSVNHQLLLTLMAKGGLLTGTESPQLLLKEYDAIKNQMNYPFESSAEHSGRALLKQRDQFIAHRIDQTLNAGETGLIFLGILHNLENYLNQDIHLIYPLHHPAETSSS